MKEEICYIGIDKHYLNDVLVELTYYKKPFIFEYQNKKFKAYPENAIEFCMDYSKDTYSQNVQSINDTMEGLMNFMNCTGDIIELMKK
jgi:hypothetical protein